MGLSQADRDAILNYHFRGGAAPTIPATYYIALLTTNPTDETGTGAVEVSTANWTNYARQAITDAAGSWNAPSGTVPRKITNVAAINYGTAATTGTVTVTGFAAYDAASAGTFKFWGSITPSALVQNGDPTSFAAGALEIDL